MSASSSRLARLFLPLIGMLFLCGLFPANLSAAEYYVRPDGNNVNSGTGSAPSQAWQSVNEETAPRLAPGDTVYFLANSIIVHRIPLRLIGVAGAAGSPIKFTSHPAGTRARIDMTGRTTPGISILKGCKFITIENLEVHSAPGVGVVISGQEGTNPAVTMCESITLQKIFVYNSGANGIDARHGDKIELLNCEVYFAGENGIRFTGTDEPSTRIRNSKIIDCIVRGAKGQDGIVIHEASNGNVPAKPLAGSGFVIENCVSSGNKENGFDITTGSDVQLIRNTSFRNGQGGVLIGHTANNVRVSQHYAFDEPLQNAGATVRVTTTNVVIEDCVLIGSSVQTKPIILVNPGTDGETLPENIVINNNTLVWNNSVDSGASISIAKSIVQTVLPTRAFRITNNVIGSRTNCNGFVALSGIAPNNPQFVMNWNLYHMPSSSADMFRVGYATAPLTSYTNTQFAAFRDATKLEQAALPPLNQASAFVSTALSENRTEINFRVAETEKVKDLGWRFGADEIARHDFTGNENTKRSDTPDLGAYETTTGPGPRAPANLIATPLSGKRIFLSWRDHASEETGYEIQRNGPPLNQWEPVTAILEDGPDAGNEPDISNLIPGNSVAFDHFYPTNSATDLLASKTYQYRIRAVEGGIYSAWSPVAVVSTPAPGAPGAMPTVNVSNLAEEITLNSGNQYLISGLTYYPIRKFSATGSYNSVSFQMGDVPAGNGVQDPAVSGKFDLTWDLRVYGLQPASFDALSKLRATGYNGTGQGRSREVDLTSTTLWPGFSPSVQIVSQDEKQTKLKPGQTIVVDTFLNPISATIQKVIFNFKSAPATMIQTEDSTAPYEYTVPLNTPVNSIADVEVIAIDNKGNYARTLPLRLNIVNYDDFYPPDFKFGLADPNVLIAGAVRGDNSSGKVFLGIDYITDISAIQQPIAVSYRRLDPESPPQPVTDLSSTATGFSASWDVSQISNGLYELAATVTDARNNVQKKTFRVYLDNLASATVTPPFVKFLPIPIAGEPDPFNIAGGQEEEAAGALGWLIRKTTLTEVGVIVMWPRGPYSQTVKANLTPVWLEGNVTPPAPKEFTFSRIGTSNVYTANLPSSALTPLPLGVYEMVLVAGGNVVNGVEQPRATEKIPVRLY